MSKKQKLFWIMSENAVCKRNRRICFKGLLCIICILSYVFPIPVYGESDSKSQEQLESEAAENYDKTVDRLSRIYEDAMSDVLNDPDKILDGKTPGEWFYYHIYAIYHSIRKTAPFLGAISVLMGTVLCFIIRRNKQLFKKILVILVFGIPLLLTLFVFGVGAII